MCANVVFTFYIKNRIIVTKEGETRYVNMRPLWVDNPDTLKDFTLSLVNARRSSNNTKTSTNDPYEELNTRRWYFYPGRV